MSERKAPEIRFRGFRGEWECKLFSEVFDATIPNNTLSRANLNYEGGEIQNIHYGDILIKFAEITNVKKSNIPFITDPDIVKYKGQYLLNGDVIFADTAEDETVGKATEITGIGEGKVVSGLHTIPVRPKNLKPVGYLGYYINSNFYHKQLLALMQGIKVLSISKRNIANTSISYPLWDGEQAQIGEFFKNLDNLIAQKQKKYDKLVNMKKACLDKMFPKDGADTPEVRFQGFSGAWETNKFEQLAKYRNGKAHENNIVDSGDYIVVNSKFVSTNGKVKKYTDLQIEPLKKYDIAFVLSDVPNGRAIAKTFLIDEDDKYSLNQRIAGITALENISPYFLHLLLNRNKYFLMFDDGVKQTNLSLQDVYNFEAFFSNYTEQTKIGNFFQNIDHLITLQKTALEKLKNIKKACLDKMFI